MPNRPAGLLARLGLDRAELRAWAMYDWANSAMMVVVVTAIFPIFFSAVAASGMPRTAATARFSIATTIGLALIAVTAPLLGTIADRTASKLRLLGLFLLLGAAATAAMYFIRSGDWLLALVLFVLANVGANGSFVFYDALLPHVARHDEMDRVSTAGYALGYIGGGLLLAFCLVMTQRPAWFGLPHGPGLSADQAALPARISFVLTALWWALFSIPLFRHVAEPPAPPRAAGAGRSAVVESVVQLRRTFRDLAGYRQALLMLVAFLLYNDGIGTIIRMAAIYGEEMGLSRGIMIGAIVMVQFVGIPFAFLFGSLAGRIGARHAIFLGLAAYVGICILGYFMRTATHFLILAGLVGVVQGGTQALSRSLFASLIPRQKSGEFFGFFSVFEKFAGIFGPAVFSVAILLTGSSRSALLSIILFFIAGAWLLARVDVTAGQRRAREAEQALEAA
ncbi:MAG TPA: MFS transporter [Gemmatimonadales bacterium]|jgi:UMF1 family MFS transporter|nr:MFS transporter [Gemmatimonadales bacterium]